MKELRTIDLRKGKLKVIHDGALDSLISLRKMKLKNNEYLKLKYDYINQRPFMKIIPFLNFM